jgi:hypothetical protein
MKEMMPFKAMSAALFATADDKIGTDMRHRRLNHR